MCFVANIFYCFAEETGDAVIFLLLQKLNWIMHKRYYTDRSELQLGRNLCLYRITLITFISLDIAGHKIIGYVNNKQFYSGEFISHDSTVLELTTLESLE